MNALNKSLGVDRPLLTQYWSWVSDFVRGTWTSYQYQSPVRPFVVTALGHSLKLAAVAFVIVVPLAILGGVVAAPPRWQGNRPIHQRLRPVVFDRA